MQAINGLVELHDAFSAMTSSPPTNVTVER
jgi:hypothetical protein